MSSQATNWTWAYHCWLQGEPAVVVIANRILYVNNEINVLGCYQKGCNVCTNQLKQQLRCATLTNEASQAHLAKALLDSPKPQCLLLVIGKPFHSHSAGIFTVPLSSHSGFAVRLLRRLFTEVYMFTVL